MKTLLDAGLVSAVALLMFLVKKKKGGCLTLTQTKQTKIWWNLLLKSNTATRLWSKDNFTALYLSQ